MKRLSLLPAIVAVAALAVAGLLVFPAFTAGSPPEEQNPAGQAPPRPLEEHLRLGDSLLNQGLPDSALLHFRQAKALLPAGNDSLATLLDAELIRTQGNIHLNAEQYDSAVAYLQRAETLHLEGRRWEKAVYTQLDQALAFLYSGKNQDMEAVLRRAADLAERRLPPAHEAVGFILSLQGVVYNNLGDYDRSIEVTRRTVSFVQAQTPVDSGMLATQYNNLGVFYRNKGDYYQAIEYDLASLNLKRLDTKSPAGNLAISYGNIGNTYQRMGRYDEALFYGRRHLRILEAAGPPEAKPDDYIAVFNNMGAMFSEAGRPDSAFAYLKRALDLHRFTEKGKAITLHNLGYAAVKAGDYPAAIDYYRQAVAINQALLPPGHPELARNLRHLGRAFVLQGDAGQALDNLRQALFILVPAFRDTAAAANPVLRDFTSPTDLLKTLRDKGKALELRARRGGAAGDWEAAFLAYERAVELVDTLRNDYQEGSQQFWNEEIRPLYESAIRVAAQSYRQGGGERYLEAAFRFAEKSKAALLAAAVQQSAARRMAGIPEELLQREKELQLDMAFYRERVFREQQKGEKADTSKILLWQNKVLDRRQSYDSLLTRFETAYPVYYQLRYQESTAGIAEVRRSLPADAALVAYFWGDSSLYAFTVDAEGARLADLGGGEALPAALQALLDQLRDRVRVNEEGLSPALFSEFTGLAAGLYRQLLAPAIETPPARLIVIPDGMLGYLPFELLLTDAPPAGAPVDYAGLPYLLRDSRVRYEYSATLLLRPPAPRKGRGGLAGFAPSYGGDVLAAARDAEVYCGDAREATFGNLSQNGAEVEGIAALWRGKPFTGAAATEAAFKETAARHRVLHLAMHGFINHCDPLYSGLVFSQTTGGGTAESRDATALLDSLPLAPATTRLAAANDGFLHAYEIYNMQLPAELAVLSACHTGAGKLARGEGVMSLARAFKYAGCPNVVMSLWQADDAATARIMQDFYRLLRDGEGKDEALRQAKLAFLDGSRRNHPFFWGTFVLIGDDAPLRQGPGPALIFGVVGLLAALGGAVWYGLRRKREAVDGLTS